MRAMILAAGLGTRMQPLSLLRAKPALPVRGRPVIGYLLELLRQHGVDEVMINLHHLPASVEWAVASCCPRGIRVHYSREKVPLGTGGALRRVRDFLRKSDPALVLAGDMLLDVDLGGLLAEHRESRSDCTLLLREDERAERFGSIGLDASGNVRRIGRRFDLGDESSAGLFPGVRLISPRAFDFMPQQDVFEDLRDWLAPALSRGEIGLRGRLLPAEACVWEPVGTPEEYLRVNLQPPRLTFFPPTGMVARGTKLIGRNADVVLGAGSELGPGARLARSVIWENERIPAGFEASGGVFAAGNFYVCEQPSRADGEQRNE